MLWKSSSTPPTPPHISGNPVLKTPLFWHFFFTWAWELESVSMEPEPGRCQRSRVFIHVCEVGKNQECTRAEVPPGKGPPQFSLPTFTRGVRP